MTETIKAKCPDCGVEFVSKVLEHHIGHTHCVTCRWKAKQQPKPEEKK